MKVIWAWNNSDNNGINFEYGHKLRVALLAASVRSWEFQYPEDMKILYCCQNTYDQIKTRRWDRFWDEIHIVDFDKCFKDLGVYDTPCWGIPKVFVMTLQKEPYIILDTDMYVTGNFKKGLDREKIWVSAEYNQKNVFGKKDVCVNVDSKIKKLSYVPESGWTGDSYNSGLMYFPDPEVGRLAANRSLVMYRELYDFGCFEGIKRTDSIPNRVAEYVMFSDEEIAFHTIKESGTEVEILRIDPKYNSEIHHEFVKWGLTREEYVRKVHYLLKLARLPKSTLTVGEKEQGMI